MDKQIVDLDAKRNKTREALRKLKETEKSGKFSHLFIT